MGAAEAKARPLEVGAAARAQPLEAAGEEGPEAEEELRPLEAAEGVAGKARLPAEAAEVCQ